MHWFIWFYIIYIIFTFIIISWTLSYNCNTFSKKLIHNFSDYNTILDELKTGDCIFLASNTIEGKLIKFWSECCFTHAGIVVVKDNTKYIWECDMTTKYKNKLTGKFNSGCHLIDLENKLKNYRGPYGLHMKYNKEINEEKLWNILKKYKTDNFNKNFFCWWSAYNKVLFPLCESKNDNKFCSELVAETYQKYGIFDKSLNANMYTVKDIYDECLKKEFTVNTFFKLKDPLYYFLKSWTN